MDTLVPIAPTDASTLNATGTGYKARRDGMDSDGTAWEWRPFTSSARKDGSVFYHWGRADESGADHVFAKYNRALAGPRYSPSEWAAVGDHPQWTKVETDVLFDAVHAFHGRFLVVADRWHDLLRQAGVNDARSRTPEELKGRYYAVATAVAGMRKKASAVTGGGKGSAGGNSKREQAALSSLVGYSFDEQYEKARKHQLNSQYVRDPTLVKEERALKAAVRRMEPAYRGRKDRVAAKVDHPPPFPHMDQAVYWDMTLPVIPLGTDGKPLVPLPPADSATTNATAAGGATAPAPAVPVGTPSAPLTSANPPSTSVTPAASASTSAAASGTSTPVKPPVHPGAPTAVVLSPTSKEKARRPAGMRELFRDGQTIVFALDEKDLPELVPRFKKQSGKGSSNTPAVAVAPARAPGSKPNAAVDDGIPGITLSLRDPQVAARARSKARRAPTTTGVAKAFEAFRKDMVALMETQAQIVKMDYELRLLKAKHASLLTERHVAAQISGRPEPPPPVLDLPKTILGSDLASETNVEDGSKEDVPMEDAEGDGGDGNNKDKNSGAGGEEPPASSSTVAGVGRKRGLDEAGSSTTDGSERAKRSKS